MYAYVFFSLPENEIIRRIFSFYFLFFSLMKLLSHFYFSSAARCAIAFTGKDAYVGVMYECR